MYVCMYLVCMCIMYVCMWDYVYVGMLSCIMYRDPIISVCLFYSFVCLFFMYVCMCVFVRRNHRHRMKVVFAVVLLVSIRKNSY